MSQEQYIQISSKYRTNPADPPGNCRIEQPQILKAGTYRLVYCLVPNTFYTVNDTNNQMSFNEGASDIAITLPNGFYDGSAFPVMLKTVMDNAGTQIYTVTLSPVSNKITIEAVGAFQLLFSGNDSTSAGGGAQTLIGFSSTDTAMAVSHTAPNMVNLSPVHTINISIEDISTVSQRNLQGTSFIIPIPAGSLNYINYISGDNFEQVVTFHSSKRIISVVFRDDRNNVIDLNGIDWMILMSRVDDDNESEFTPLD